MEAIVLTIAIAISGYLIYRETRREIIPVYQFKNISDPAQYPDRYDQPSSIVIHHTGKNTRDWKLADIARIQREREALGFPPGIVYHYVIDREGNIYQTNPEGKITPHAKGWNQESIGVALIGDFETYTPPKGQLAALFWLLDKKGLPAYTHRFTKAGATACPGRLLINDLPANENFIE
jgi:N-acetyl-anhydromuramyl-L-alanine amidase AmpD